MKAKFVVITAVVLALIAGVSVSLRPNESVSIAIDDGVGRYLDSSLRTRSILDSGVVFETRPLSSSGMVESRSRARIQAFAAALHALPVHGDTVMVCAAHDPGTCTLRHANTLIAFSDATIRGNVAVVRVIRHFLTGIPRIPVAYSEIELHLTFDRSRWRVTSARVLAVS